jgi:hypothetical protein
VPTTGTWRPVAAAAAPIGVPASAGEPPPPGLPVGAAVFTSATTGWVVTGGGTSPMSYLLHTEDAGASWTAQLAWPGTLLGRLRAFGPGRAALALGLWPGAQINGRSGAAGQTVLLAGTHDAGATWTLGSPPDKHTAGAYFLSPQQFWLRVHVPGSAFTTDLARTCDGGATWERIGGTGYPPMIDVVFASPACGLLVEQDRHQADLLSSTSDGGQTWQRLTLTAPAGVPRSAETWLLPVPSPDPGTLLTLRAVARSRKTFGPGWEGVWAYTRGGDDWAGPHGLPSAPASVGHDVLAAGPDGRFWAASGHDVWDAGDLAGPWRHRRVPLPPQETVADLCPVAGGVWLMTGAGVGGGELYRGDEDGYGWRRVL